MTEMTIYQSFAGVQAGFSAQNVAVALFSFL
jgi:hypothetical protein